MSMTLDEYIRLHRKESVKSSDFVTYLYKLMDEKGMNAPTLYKRANITKQAYSSIISNKSIPTLNTLIKIIFALRLNNRQCKYLLKKVGYTLASSSIYALIIRYCIENEIYDLATLNDYLTAYGFSDALII